MPRSGVQTRLPQAMPFFVLLLWISEGFMIPWQQQLRQRWHRTIISPSHNTKSNCFDGRFFTTSHDHDCGASRSQNDPSIESHKRHLVSWETANGTVQFQAFDGETLRTAALRRGIVSPHNGQAQLINCECMYILLGDELELRFSLPDRQIILFFVSGRGLGTCGTCACAVEVKNCSRNGSFKL